MSTNVMNIPTGMVLVPVQLQSGGGGTGSVPGSSPDTSLLEFKRRSPQALGTVQIMVGLMLFLFGLMMCFIEDTLTVVTGVFVWAPLFYIGAGSLTVAADRTMSPAMIKGSMAMNIVTAVVSCGAINIYAIDMLSMHDDGGEGNPFEDASYRYMSLMWGIFGVQFVFNLLVFCVSISVSVFGCKATCGKPNSPTVQYVMSWENQLPQGSTVMTAATPTAPPSYNDVISG